MDQPDTGSAAAAITTPSPTRPAHFRSDRGVDIEIIVPMPESDVRTPRARRPRRPSFASSMATPSSSPTAARSTRSATSAWTHPRRRTRAARSSGWVPRRRRRTRRSSRARRCSSRRTSPKSIDFDRLLRYVWLADGTAWTLVNLELVRQGVAIAKSYPPDVRYDALYEPADADAQVAALGLYAATPAPTAEPTARPTSKPTAKPTPKPTPKRTPSRRRSRSRPRNATRPTTPAFRSSAIWTARTSERWARRPFKSSVLTDYGLDSGRRRTGGCDS